jgi:ArsR family transcriptional regulator
MSSAPSIDFRDLGSAFHALADVGRLRIVQLLAARDELTVSDLTRSLHISQPLVSWHLRRLRRARLILTRREGRQVYCSLNRPRLLACLHIIGEWTNQSGIRELSHDLPVR